MIVEMKKWCEGIIIAVIISIIIEMIIPDGKNKKYIKVIIGVYIMFVSLSPLLGFLKYDLKFDDFEKIAETSSNTIENSQNIKDIYILGIEENLKNEIENLGYKVNSVKIFTDLNYENIEKIELKIDGKKGEISNIKIGENNENYEDIINLIETKFFTKKENIIFK